MAVTTQTAEQALKIVYKGVVTEQLNISTNPLYNYIGSSTKDISGKEVRKMAPYGVNGGVGADAETAALPVPGGNNYIQFVSELKNLYGTIRISDKSIKASRNDVGAFVRLLSQELEGLMRAAKFNYGRQLFTDGRGALTNLLINTAVNLLEVVSTQFLIEGMIIDIRQQSDGALVAGGGTRRVLAVDRVNRRILIDGAPITTTTAHMVTVQGSFNQELTGLAAIFQSSGTLYGVNRAQHFWMIPQMRTGTGLISDIKIQRPIDDLDEIMGSKVDYISTASGVRRSYQQYMEATKRTVNTMDLKGGFTALSYNGIPMVNDRFMPAGAMKLLNTKEFTFHQMGDWDWMDDDGRVLKQVPGFPIWTASLVKYAELVCDHPGGQGMLTGITEETGV